jgi:RNA recognition motif-containing protein
VRVRIGTDKLTGKARGFAFAQFGDAARAADAIRRFDAYELRGRRLRVNDADDKPPARAPRPLGAAPRPMNGPPPAPATVETTDWAAFASRGGDDPPRRGGGSRRGLRARKRSLRWAGR